MIYLFLQDQTLNFVETEEELKQILRVNLFTITVTLKNILLELEYILYSFFLLNICWWEKVGLFPDRNLMQDPTQDLAASRTTS